MSSYKFRRSRSPIESLLTAELESLLAAEYAKVDRSKLSKVKVSIKRGDIIPTGPILPLERGIDDPKDISAYVHVRKDFVTPPQIPIFGRNIKVNQDFSENRTVFTQEKLHSSRRKRRSRSSSVGNRSRHSRSKDRSRRSSSRTKRSTSRSSSYEKKNRRGRRRYRSRSPGRLRKSRSISISPSKHVSYCPMYRSPTRRRSRSITRRSRRKSRFISPPARRRSRSVSPPARRRSRSISPPARRRSRSVSPPARHRSRSISPPARRRSRSITPLKPGEYRPGHPDLALRRLNRGRSPRNEPSSSGERKKSSPVKPRSPHRARTSRSPSRERFGAMPMTGLEYAFHDGFAPYPMGPYRGSTPMAYPRLYPPPGMMMPRFMMPPMPRVPFRLRWPVYNSSAVRPPAPKPATITSLKDADSAKQTKDDGEGNQDVSSSDKPTSSN